MGRPPSIPVETKTRIVLAVIAGEISVAEAARREKASEQSIGRADPGPGCGCGRDPGLEEVGGGPVGPFEDLEVIRQEAGMSTARWCERLDIPERTWRHWQAKARAGKPAKGSWPQPARDAAAELIDKHPPAHPAWGHRKICVTVRHDGHDVSEATVLRRLRDRGLILPDNYQHERHRLAERRKAPFAKEPTGPNQVWQLDFSEFETTTGGTWRIAGCRDYWSKFEHRWHVSPTANQHDAIDAVELALADY